MRDELTHTHTHTHILTSLKQYGIERMDTPTMEFAILTTWRVFPAMLLSVCMCRPAYHTAVAAAAAASAGRSTATSWRRKEDG